MPDHKTIARWARHYFARHADATTEGFLVWVHTPLAKAGARAVGRGFVLDGAYQTRSGRRRECLGFVSLEKIIDHLNAPGGVDFVAYYAPILQAVMTYDPVTSYVYVRCWPEESKIGVFALHQEWPPSRKPSRPSDA